MFVDPRGIEGAVVFTKRKIESSWIGWRRHLVVAHPILLSDFTRSVRKPSFEPQFGRATMQGMSKVAAIAVTWFEIVVNRLSDIFKSFAMCGLLGAASSVTGLVSLATASPSEIDAGVPTEPNAAAASVLKTLLRGGEQPWNQYQSIDRLLPGPAPALAGPSNRLLSVSRTGVLTVEPSIRIRLAGLLCTEGLQQSVLATLAGDDDTRVVFAGIESDEAEISIAYVWLLRHRAGGAQSFISVNDLAARNRWCVPIQEPGHLYYQRYLALWIFDHRFPLDNR